MNLAAALESVNEKLEKSPLFFLAAEAERGLGLEADLQNYYIVSSTQDYISSQLKQKDKGNAWDIAGGTAKLTVEKDFVDYVVSKSGHFLAEKTLAYFQFFKPQDTDLVSTLSTQNITAQVLNNSAELTRTIDNKIRQFQLLTEAGFSDNLPESNIGMLKDFDIIQLFANEDFVVQLPFGHTGSSTYLAGEKSETDLVELQRNYPNRVCKVSKHLAGQPFTINACCYGEQVFVGGLSYQYTGVKSLTSINAATVGNDWSLPAQLLSVRQVEAITDLTVRIGKFLSGKHGYRGLFGLDLIVDQSGKAFLIEINPRQTASVPMYTKLQLEAEQIPLSLIHLAEFLDIRGLDINEAEYNQVNTKAISAAQLFLRSQNESEYTLPTAEIKPGVYRQLSDNSARELIANGHADQVLFLDSAQDRPLARQSEELIPARIPGDGFLLQLKAPGQTISFNEEIARIQIKNTLGTVLDGVVRINPLATDTFAKLKSITSL